jgi:hypothetical protein
MKTNNIDFFVLTNKARTNENKQAQIKLDWQYKLIVTPQDIEVHKGSEIILQERNNIKNYVKIRVFLSEI